MDSLWNYFLQILPSPCSSVLWLCLWGGGGHSLSAHSCLQIHCDVGLMECDSPWRSETGPLVPGRCLPVI